ncbi:DUF3047 domain-containing protein [Pseudonocardia acidicola]|uniref:DUF3047 domain-containing protein n=1 Tax=Pseudonocardia acidicola TaxID=2724939 RepID=A0ABX1S635_9PSEU|nr:DUF3047 domain-containing protein [Pseudonocardia acidicola]NMH96247.1 DUF3047 domain-containing protein [Pseudonocardia acidicola]
MTRSTTAPEVVHLVLPGNRPPWTRTGLTVRRGDRVTLLGSGFVRWSDAHDVGAGAKFHLWGRVPGGATFGCTQDTTTVVADRDGELELCVYMGAWADRYGTLATGDAPYRRTSGALQVTVLRWPEGTDPVAGLAALDAGVADPVLAAAESDRLADPVVPPPGWEYLQAFGPGDIYRHARCDGRPAIDVVCDNDAGIIRTDVDLALDPDTTIEWTWRVDALPGTSAENTTWTHDYLSIAAEFDSGRDLTWFWSSALRPVEDTFACPVRGWRDRETHMPVRSGTSGLGTPCRESRDVYADHLRFMGPPPGRIVRVWLIAVSHFGRGLGRATFTDIALRNRERRIQVL